MIEENALTGICVECGLKTLGKTGPGAVSAWEGLCYVCKKRKILRAHRDFLYGEKGLEDDQPKS